MARKVYKHGLSIEHRDWILIILLYTMIGFMISTAILAVDNYVLRGHQCMEGKYDDGTTRKGDPTQGNADPTSKTESN